MDVVSEHEHKECGPFERNVDYRGFKVLYTIQKMHTKWACEKKCRAEKRCAAWTWGHLHLVAGLSDVCTLKEAVPGKQAAKIRRFGVDSGVRENVKCASERDSMALRILTGHVKSKHGICLEAANRSVGMADCIEGKSSQVWRLDEETGQLLNADGACLSAPHRAKPYASLEVAPCDTGNWSQQWMHDDITGLIKSWRGACLDAGERLVNGGQVYMQTCNAKSTNEQWVFPVSGDQPPPERKTPGSLYCFALMLPGSYEQDLLAMQFNKGVSLFACNEYAVYSNRVIEVAPGVNTSVVNSDLKCGKGGEFGTALNLDIFIAVWTKVVSEDRFLVHDWTAKVDPDAVFFPDRLLKVLEVHPETQEGVYLNNCKFGMHGPVEVFSKNAVVEWATGSPRCVEHFQKQCGGDCFWGEDLFVDQCLWKVLGVRRENDFRILLEDHCEPPADWATCTEADRVTFHPFKTEEGYKGCLANASNADIRKPRYGTALEAPWPASKLQPAKKQWHTGIQMKRNRHETEQHNWKPRHKEPHQSEEHHWHGCHTAVQGEECHHAVLWAMRFGIREHPKWYKGLTSHSHFKQFQAVLHHSRHVDCPMPCTEDGDEHRTRVTMH